MGTSKLTSFDLFTLNMAIKGAWLYRNAPDFEGMKKALARLSELYPQLGGRYDGKSKSLVWADGQTVTLPFASCDLRAYSVDELKGNAKVWSLVKEYDLKAFKSGKAMPFSALLGYLKDGAVLYVQCAHATMDGAAFYELVNQWAALYRGEAVRPMVADPSQIPAEDCLSREETLRQVCEKGWIRVRFRQLFKMIRNLGRNKRIRTTYDIEVSQNEIQRLKELSGAGTNAVLAAIAIQALSRHMPNCRPFRLLFVADLRERVTGISRDFFGNASQPVIAEGLFDPKDETAALASRIDLSLGNMLTSGRVEENVRLSLCCSHYGLPYYYFDASDMNSADPGTVYFNNQLKFRPCELEWGHGLPEYAFPNELTDMVKFWQPVTSGPVRIIFGGLASKIMEKPTA